MFVDRKQIEKLHSINLVWRPYYQAFFSGTFLCHFIYRHFFLLFSPSGWSVYIWTTQWEKIRFFSMWICFLFISLWLQIALFLLEKPKMSIRQGNHRKLFAIFICRRQKQEKKECFSCFFLIKISKSSLNLSNHFFSLEIATPINLFITMCILLIEV